MSKKVKEKDLICGNCGMVYPLKVIRGEIVKIHGFNYAYCFKCRKFSRHQSIDSIDLYICELESKDMSDYSGKDKILSKHLLK